MNTRGRLRRWLFGLAGLGCVVAAGLLWGPEALAWVQSLSEKTPEPRSGLHRSTVKRGDLRITVVEDGQLRAVKHHTIASKLPGRAKVAWLVDEGTEVAEGDKVIEFEREPIEEKIRMKEKDLEAARLQLVVAEENLKIESSDGESRINAAELRLEDARDARKKYRELEAPRRFKDLAASRTEAERKVEAALDTLREKQRQADNDLFSDEEQERQQQKKIDQAEAAVDSARKALEKTVHKEKMFRAYEYPDTLQDKEEAVQKAELELAKVAVAVKGQLLQKKAQRNDAEKMVKRIEKELAEAREQLEQTVVEAPASGMVLYGDPRRRRYRSSNNELKVGGEVWQNRGLMTIPDFSVFEIDISIGEEYRGKLQVGCEAVITVEAIPGLKLSGTLKRISSLAQPRNRWDRSSPKVFSATVALNETDERMVSGMTCRVEILAEVVRDVLMLPLEAVWNVDGEPVCFVPTPQGFEQRPVKPGKANDHYVEIVEGLSEGDAVFVTDPRKTGGDGVSGDISP